MLIVGEIRTLLLMASLNFQRPAMPNNAVLRGFMSLGSQIFDEYSLIAPDKP